MRLPLPKDYPKTVRLGEEVYKVVFVKFVDDTYGECDPGAKEIRLKKGMSRQETLKTYIHEVLHLVEFEHPLKIKHKMIYKLEEAIYRFLIDNYFLG